MDRTSNSFKDFGQAPPSREGTPSRELGRLLSGLSLGEGEKKLNNRSPPSLRRRGKTYLCFVFYCCFFGCFPTFVLHRSVRIISLFAIFNQSRIKLKSQNLGKVVWKRWRALCKSESVCGWICCAILTEIKVCASEVAFKLLDGAVLQHLKLGSTHPKYGLVAIIGACFHSREADT